MTDFSAVDEVVSGAPYVVHRVNDRPPTGLDDFVAAPLVEVTAESRNRTIRIRGESRRDGDAVILYEKDGGTGKDVRTWTVRDVEGHFEVAERAAF